ncbi:acyltransferase [Phenylobacterium sp. SCN 70-31]|uniref:acyltransferase family protein n=1 Tax=Phenylobacterium sp. SCN 70-31 TaxID=1660129 RepID=UPI00086AC0C7|nr:acyltransferase [Phenylobacterium sp. SCN 70-31]ODT84223.1 MAG: acyltransferase [Phenylobacterium sp. SCN 70-31]
MGSDKPLRREGSPLTPFPNNLPALTSVRFALALGVVLFHYQLQWPWDSMASTGLLDRARLGVDAFFVLSGFVLTHAYRQTLEERRLDYRRFLAARFARVYPAHVAVLAFVLVMVGAATLMGAEYDHRLYNPLGLLTTLLLVHAWLPETVVAEWNGPSWSLSAEWFAYLAFPAFAWVGLVLARRPWVLLALSGLVFLVLDLTYQAVFGDVVVHAELNMGVLRIIPEFLYGIGLYRLGQRLRPTRRSAIGASWLSAITLLALMHLKADDRIVVAAAGPLILSLGLLSKASADRALAQPWMLASGEASYALYLVHMPILIGWKGVNSALTQRPSAYVLAWWEIACLLALTLFAAFAVHYLFEGPARTWIRRRADRLWPAPGSRAAMAPGSQPPDI